MLERRIRNQPDEVIADAYQAHFASSQQRFVSALFGIALLVLFTMTNPSETAFKTYVESKGLEFKQFKKLDTGPFFSYYKSLGPSRSYLTFLNQFYEYQGPSGSKTP